MRRLAIGLLVIVAAVGLVLLQGRGLSAVGRRPWPLEERAARAIWRVLVPSRFRAMSNPVPATPDELKGAREHWANHCAVCHDNDGSGSTTIGARVYPPMPDMRSPQIQSLSDGELFYAIEQGVPWTAMPGWTTRTPQGERESWALVRFIRHLPSVTVEELRDMERLNPKPPPNPELEKEIDDFLNGPRPTKSGRGGLVP
jgi:mono/diheme cytochrome c family protein